MGEYNISSGHMTFAKASNKLDFSNILLYQIRLIAPNKISLGIFPISFPPRPFPRPSATPTKIFVIRTYGLRSDSGARHYCHIVLVCSWAKAHIFGGKTAQRANLSLRQLRLSLVMSLYPDLILRALIRLFSLI
jgi:hypothetical protein